MWDEHKKKVYKTDVFSSALNRSFPPRTSTYACEFVFQEFVFLLKYNQLIAPICDTKILFTH